MTRFHTSRPDAWLSPRKIFVERNGEPAWVNAPPRTLAPTPMADWLKRHDEPRPFWRRLMGRG